MSVSVSQSRMALTATLHMDVGKNVMIKTVTSFTLLFYCCSVKLWDHTFQTQVYDMTNIMASMLNTELTNLDSANSFPISFKVHFSHRALPDRPQIDSGRFTLDFLTE